MPPTAPLPTAPPPAPPLLARTSALDGAEALLEEAVEHAVLPAAAGALFCAGCCALLLWRRVLCDGKRSSRARLLPASERHTSSTSEAQVEAVELADEREAALPKPGLGYTDL